MMLGFAQSSLAADAGDLTIGQIGRYSLFLERCSKGSKQSLGTRGGARDVGDDAGDVGGRFGCSKIRRPYTRTDRVSLAPRARRHVVQSRFVWVGFVGLLAWAELFSWGRKAPGKRGVGKV